MTRLGSEHLSLPPRVFRWGNLPVPYVAAWSSEEAVFIRRDSLTRTPAIFRGGQRSQGRPIFGKMDESRVRRVVIQRLCQVCLASISSESFAIDVPHGRMGSAPMISEPPVCRKCLALTLVMCPGVQRQLGKPRVLVARVRRYETVAAMIGPKEGGDEQLNTLLRAWKGDPVVGYVKPALTDYDVLTADEVHAIAGISQGTI